MGRPDNPGVWSAGRAGGSALSVIGVFAVLAKVVLILERLWGPPDVRINDLAAIGHLGAFLQHHGVVDRLKGILAPDEGAVILARTSGPRRPFWAAPACRWTRA